MSGLLLDLRYALRALRTSPGFTLTVVLTLGLGIGATTAVFSVADAVLFRPLPFADPDRLFLLTEGSDKVPIRLPSYPNARDYAEQAKQMSVVYVLGETLSLRGPDGAERCIAARVGPGFFGLIGTQPFLGRGFSADDDRPGGPRVAVLSYGMWERRFGRDPSMLGRSLDSGEGSYTIVGVMPRGVRYPTWADVFTPIGTATSGALEQRGMHADSRTMVRLAPGATEASAGAELAAISRRLAEAYPRENAGFTARLSSVSAEVVGSVGPQILLLGGAVLLVLLIACVNVTNLALARGAKRTREVAIRTALGAGRRHIVRQLLAEHLLLALLGGAAGVLLALWAVDFLTSGASNPATDLVASLVPRLEEVGVDGRALGFTLGVTALAGILTGLAPALAVTRPSLVDTLKDGSNAAGVGLGRRRLRSALVVVQVALALALLAGAGLLVASFWRVRQVAPGFDPEQLLAVHIIPPSPDYDAADSDVRTLYRRALEAAAALPGARAAALVNHMPLGAWMGTRVGIDGRPPDEGQALTVGLRTVSPEYLDALRIPLRRGRFFTGADMTPNARVAVISEAMARQFWPGEDPVGRRVTFFKSAVGRADFGEEVAAEVIGVIGDVRHFGPEQPPDAAIFIPYPVNPWGHIWIALRTDGAPGALAASLRAALRQVHPDIVLTDLGPVTQTVASSLAGRRFVVMLLAGFAAAALLLAAIGLYGVLSYLVGQRTREIGIRVALGARRVDVMRLVVGRGMALVGIGIGVGLLGAYALARLMRGLLFGVTPTDPLTLLAVTAVLAVVALGAIYLPARRATRVDPVSALRSE